MNFIYWTICLSFIFLSVIWFVRLIAGILWVGSNKHLARSNANRGSKIFIFIPVLNESNRLPETTKYFNDKFSTCCNIQIIIITTESEDLTQTNALGLTTIGAAKAMKEKYNNVRVLHYPYKDGKMAHQLNYAFLSLREEIDNDDLIGLYNADSRPHPKTLSWVIEKHQKGRSEVFQQYGNYLENFSSISTRRWGFILQGAALWQVRWSVGFEIYNALKQKHITNSDSLNYPFNYCIGHGLILNKTALEKIGGFDQVTFNEDAILGLRLCNNGEKITPIPYFDLSNTPDSINGYMTQQSNWFRGPFEAFKYFSILRKEREQNNIKSDLRLLLLSAKLFSHSIYWIAGPTFLFMLFVIPIYTRNYPLLLSSLIVSIVYVALINIVSFKIVKKENPQTAELSISPILTAWGCVIAYFLHGIGGYKGLINSVFRKNHRKMKTPMSDG